MSKTEKYDELKSLVEHCIYLMSRVQSGEEKNYTWTRVYNTMTEWLKENK